MSDTTVPHVLIAPLGLSPGAVSGMAYALRKANYPITRVIAIRTNHQDIYKSNFELNHLFATEPEIEYEAKTLIYSDLRGSDESSQAFVQAIGQKLRQAVRSGANVHVGVTSGRSGMGALASLAATLYGAHHLWHLWVADDIAENGSVKPGLPSDAAQKKRILNPTENVADYDLVALPFADMYGKIKRSILEQGTPQNPTGWSQAIQLIDYFPAELNLRDVQRLREIEQIYEASDPAQRIALNKEVWEIVDRNGLVDEQAGAYLQELIEDGAPIKEFIDFARANQRLHHFWQWLGENSGQLQVILAGFATAAAISNNINPMLPLLIAYWQFLATLL